MTSTACVTVAGAAVPLPLLERLSMRPDDGPVLRRLLAGSTADQIVVLSTCERVEVYAAWTGRARPDELLTALAAERGVVAGDLAATARVHVGEEAVRHLFRVACGLESFVLGETDIVAQVRAAAAGARESAVSGCELDRLLAAAVSTTRRVHRRTGLGESTRSVADAAVQTVAARIGSGVGTGALVGRRLLVVGAGRFATAVVARAGSLGASVTVCNRTRRHAERFRAAGASVVPLEALAGVLGDADAVILGTASPVPLVDATMVRAARRGRGGDVLVVDACLPRNVDPAVRVLPGVTLLDLADLRADGAGPSLTLARDAVVAQSVVDEEVQRFSRWLAGRGILPLVRALRDDVDAYAAAEARRVSADLAEELGSPLTDDVAAALGTALEATVHRSVRRMAHRPTELLVDAALAGDVATATAISLLFRPGDR
jgi:glutamyl-tRNA reductase